MLFGFEDSLKDLKKELKTAGADMAFVKEWQKSYDKVKKQSVLLENQYIQTKQRLEMVYTILQDMEQFFISCKTDISGTEVGKRLVEFSKELKKYQGNYNQEFLISREDSNFHLTYETIVRLCEKGVKEQKDVLILQSEVENLLAIIKEALDKEWPSFRALVYFYIEHTDKEIYDLPQQDKILNVEELYKHEFLMPIRQVLTECFGEEKANYVLEEQIWN